MKKKENKTEKPKKKHKSAIWLFGISFISVGLLLFCQFFYGDTVSEKTTYYEGTTINGIDVSGMTKKEAENVVSSKMLENLDQVSLTMTYGDKTWQYSGTDFQVNPDISQQLQEVLAYGREGNIFEKTGRARRIKKEGLAVNIPYSDILTGLDGKIDDISSQIKVEPTPQKILFSPDDEVVFTMADEQYGVEIDRTRLASLLDQEFAKSNAVKVEIPVLPLLPQKDESLMLENIGIRSTFTTDYSNSSQARKHNVKRALAQFNGMVIEPDEEISFNATTGERSEENGYKKANIIKNGVFVEGFGGGVCQASTTLYNALLLADVEITQVHHHSLPVSYVPLSTDAMVSDGYADLTFKNTTGAPIYIKTFADDSIVGVTIYGAMLDQGRSIKVRSELVSILAHGGDKIVEDLSGQYDDFVLYKGEYHRIKWPKEGYETKAYVQYLQDGKVEKEREIRHDFYYPQDGVVVEGSEHIGSGMTLPKSNVTLIPAQKVTETHLKNIREKFKTTYPNAYEA